MDRQRYQEIERLEIDACSAAAIDYERVRVDGGGTMDPPYIKAMDRWIDLQKESEQQIVDELAKERHQIIGQVQAMDNMKSRKILYQRYVKGKSIGRIAEEGYSYEHTSRMHRGR